MTQSVERKYTESSGGTRMPRRPGNNRAATAEATRQALLDAGVRILCRDPAAHAFGHLKAAHVSGEAGRTIGAFFHHWDSQRAYVDDLVEYVLAELPSTSFETLDRRGGDVLASGASVTEAILDNCRASLDLIPQDPQTIVELLLWASAPRDEHIRELARAGYDALDDRNQRFFEGFLALTGRKARPPFTTRAIGIIISNFGQALALRRAITPGAVPDDTLGWALLTLLPLLTTTDGDDRHAEQVANVGQPVPGHSPSKRRRAPAGSRARKRAD
jgi:AcrR family transcriptional regulator